MNTAFVFHGQHGCFFRSGEGPSVIVTGQRGAPGRPGTDTGGGIQTIIRTGGETVSALRVVFESQAKAYIANPANESVFQALGVSLTSGSLDSELTIQTQGFIDDASWSWAEGIVWCGANGTLTQIPPIDGWDFVIGFATSPTRLYIDLNVPVLLA